MFDVTEVIDKYGLKNNVINRIWLTAVFYVTIVVTFPVELVKAIFKK
jgi:hypothetical protein